MRESRSDIALETPHDIELEKKVLSAMLLNDGEIIPEVIDILRADDFYRPEHKIIFTAIVTAYDNNFCNVLGAEDELKKSKRWTQDLRIYLLGLLECEYSTAYTLRYARKILEESKRRKVIELSALLKEKISDDTISFQETLDEISEKILNLTVEEKSNCEDVKTIGQKALEELMTRMSEDKNLVGISTGFIDLDKMTKGLKKSELIILAARPSMGKTALALNIASQASKNVPVLIFSLEMSRGQLVQRIMSAESGVLAEGIQTGKISDKDFDLVTSIADDFGSRRLKIDDTGALTMTALRARARRVKHEFGDLGLIMIDYLQLITGSKEYRGNRVQEITEISRQLKGLARELNVPIIALSQLSRSVEARMDKRPLLSDLRESGSIEQDADVVMFLYRDEYYNNETELENIAEVIIAKNRNGATGLIQLYFEPKCVVFQNLVKEW